MDLDAAASQLYGLSPDEFAAHRKLLANQAQRAGNRQLASAIRQLRRPTTSAWLANLLVRERPTEIATLLDLGTAMHKAQADLAGAEIRRLSQQRQDAVSSLSDAARNLARGLGRDVSESILRELEETLDAAIANSEAREALAAGHLVAAMRYSGLGGVELSGVVTSQPRETNVRPRPPRREEASSALRDLQDAEAIVARAEQDAAELVHQQQIAQDEVDRCDRAIAEAEDRLRAMRRERKGAQGELGKADRALKASRLRVTGARKNETTARAAAAKEAIANN